MVCIFYNERQFFTTKRHLLTFKLNSQRSSSAVRLIPISYNLFRTNSWKFIGILSQLAHTLCSLINFTIKECKKSIDQTLLKWHESNSLFKTSHFKKFALKISIKSESKLIESRHLYINWTYFLNIRRASFFWSPPDI